MNVSRNINNTANEEYTCEKLFPEAEGRFKYYPPDSKKLKTI